MAPLSVEELKLCNGGIQPREKEAFEMIAEQDSNRGDIIQTWREYCAGAVGNRYPSPSIKNITILPRALSVTYARLQKLSLLIRE